jgi:hypothetical protein
MIDWFGLGRKIEKKRGMGAIVHGITWGRKGI